MHLNNKELVTLFNSLLIKLLEMNQSLTHNLKDWLQEPLKYYINQVATSKVIQQSELLEIKELSRKCQLLDDTFEYYNKEAITLLFKNKLPNKIELYLKVLKGLLNKSVNEKNLNMNKKYIQQVFDGDNALILKLIKETLIWFLEKYKYDYTEDQVVKVLDIIKKYHTVFVKCSNPQLKIKIDQCLQKFITEQNGRHKNLSLL